MDEGNFNIGFETNLEKYRFCFLLYLSLAKELYNVERDLQYIEGYFNLLKTGKDYVNGDVLRQEEIAIETGKILRNRFDLFSPTYEEIEQCRGQLLTHRSLLGGEENHLWSRLSLSIREIKQIDDASDVWKLHPLFLHDDSFAIERISYYEKVLMCFNSPPPSPIVLEGKFKCE